MMQHLSLFTEESCFGLLVRLSLPIPDTWCLSTCPYTKCTSTVDAKGLHLLTYGMGPGRVRLHDHIVRQWHSSTLSTGLRVRVEPRGLYQDQRWTDIVIPDLQGSQNLHLNFCATHPCLPSNVATASTSPRSSCCQEGECKGGLQGLCWNVPAIAG